jgi:hypothetical protein
MFRIVLLSVVLSLSAFSCSHSPERNVSSATPEQLEEKSCRAGEVLDEHGNCEPRGFGGGPTGRSGL